MTDDFLDNLSQPRPDPGGGAAAGHGALLALALMEKIARLEVRRKIRVEQEVLWTSILGRVQELKRDLSLLRERDTAAYLKLVEARRSEVQGPALAQAWIEAIHCPVLMIEASIQGAELLSLMGRHSSRHLVPDLQVAAEFLGAALRGAYHIAMANVALAADNASDLRHTPNMPELLATADHHFQNLRERLGMSSVLRCR